MTAGAGGPEENVKMKNGYKVGSTAIFGLFEDNAKTNG